MGDFNSKNTDTPYKIVTEQLQDCQAVAPITDSGVTYHDWGEINNNAGSAIDYCFVSKKHMTPLSFEICRNKYGSNNQYYISDHYAIKSVVRFSN